MYIYIYIYIYVYTYTHIFIWGLYYTSPTIISEKPLNSLSNNRCIARGLQFESCFAIRVLFKLIVGEITPNPPTNIVPTNIARVKLSGKSPMGLGIPPLRIKIMLESNPLKSTMLIGRLGVVSESMVKSQYEAQYIYIYIYLYT